VLSGTCPTVSFTVMGTVVKTSAATRFEGATCGTLVAGTTVEVEGTPQSDGSVLAMKVAAEVREVELHGALTVLSGTCPTVSFTVMGTVVKTSAATRFEGATCGTLVTGTTVEVEGTLQADGSVLAMKVAAEVREVELRGALTGLTGTCPTVSFTVMATVVKTSAATRFAGLTCGTLTNGTTVEVGGTQQPDGSVLALKVGREDDARPNPAER
jgi:spore coat polysaccharide biosynthesis protein SpsF (cytidylyltransferase family)